MLGNAETTFENVNERTFHFCCAKVLNTFRKPFWAREESRVWPRGGSFIITVSAGNAEHYVLRTQSEPGVYLWERGGRSQNQFYVSLRETGKLFWNIFERTSDARDWRLTRLWDAPCKKSPSQNSKRFYRARVFDFLLIWAQRRVNLGWKRPECSAFGGQYHSLRSCLYNASSVSLGLCDWVNRCSSSLRSEAQLR